MRKLVIVALSVPAVLTAGGIGFAVFEHYEREALSAKSTEACDGRDKPAPGTPATLPLGLPMTEGETVLDVAEQGATTVVFASEPGGRDDIVAVRDKVLADLAKAGYRVVGTDQEPGYEAEAELAGTHPGSLKVSPLCEGLLEVRYKIEL